MKTLSLHRFSGHKLHHGFTLLELLLYISIVGGLLSTVVIFFTTTVEARVKAQTVSEVNQQGTAALEYITGIIRDADSITTPAVAGSGTTLTIAVPTGSLSPTVIDLSGTTLQIKEGTGTAVALTDSKVQVSNLLFKNLTRSGTPGVISISFLVSRANPNSRNEFDFQKNFYGTAALRWP